MIDRHCGGRLLRALGLTLLLACLTVSTAAAQGGAGGSAGPGAGQAPGAPPPPDPNGLIGTWIVDLRPTPNAEPYFQEFVVESIGGNTFTGKFYGKTIEEARINTVWGAVHFAFVTRDNSGAYNHSGVMQGDRLGGLTHSLGRDFLAVWSALREE